MSILLWLFTFALSFSLASRCTKPGSTFYILDQPNHRSLHDSPIPRSGGVAIISAILLMGVIAACLHPTERHLLGIVLGLLCVSVVGFIDDIRSIRPRYRFSVQVLAALLLIGFDLQVQSLAFPGGGWQFLPVVALTLTILFVVWMVNLYNFMDGMDGLAGAMAMLGFAALGLLGWMAGEMLYMLINGIIAAASLGFLIWNFPPAKLFLGDAGSYGLGFLSAGMLLWGEKSGIFPLWIGLLIFSPFIVDATSTLLLRLLRGEKLWQAHREHAYQQAVQSGLGHRGTLLWSLVIILGVCVSGVLLNGASTGLQWFGIVIWAIFYISVFWYVRKKRYNPAGPDFSKQ